MNGSSFINDMLFNVTYLLSWRDALEISFFSTLIYYFSVWLKKDRHKNLLGYFYSYCFFTLCAYVLNLSTITYLVCLCSPIALLLFIMIHQQTLQKNFVTLRNIMPAQKDTNDWLDMLIRSNLKAINKNKEILCIIEHKDNLQDMLTTPLGMHADIQEDLLAIIVESQSFDQQHLLWINSRGKILGINARWHTPVDQQWHSDEMSLVAPWKQDALFFTDKVDALVMHVSPTTRSFDLIVRGKQYEKMSAGAVVPFIKKYLMSPQSSLGETTHATQPKKHSAAQRSS